MAQSTRFPLRKPPGFHWDFFLLGITTFIAGLLGVPAPNGLIPQAPIHTESLLVMGPTSKKNPQTTSSTKNPAHTPPNSPRSAAFRRLTNKRSQTTTTTPRKPSLSPTRARAASPPCTSRTSRSSSSRTLRRLAMARARCGGTRCPLLLWSSEYRTWRRAHYVSSSSPGLSNMCLA